MLHVRSSTVRCVAIVLAALGTPNLKAVTNVKEQQVDTPEILIVRHFLDSIKKHDLPAQLGSLTPDAQAYRYRNGNLVVSKLGDVLKDMAKGNGTLSTADASKAASEPIDEIGSQSFNQIATVWTRYRFIVEGKVHHCGHTIYSLIKHDNRWMIANVVDEAETACN